MTSRKWKAYIGTREDERVVEEIKKHALVERPLGDNDFLR